MAGMGYNEEPLKQFGNSLRNRYLYSLYLSMGIVRVICRLHNYANVGYLKGYVAHFCYIRHKSFDTLLKVVEMHHDHVSANCLLRMLADCMAVFRLVYLESDEDLRMLRHALYVIDGCEKNLMVLPEELDINKDAMPEMDFQYYKGQVRGNREHRKRLMDEANEILANSPLKEKDKAAFDKIVKAKNWKFRHFATLTKSYSWAELYKMIDRVEGHDVFSFLSQYAHGLSMSNLVITNKVADRNSLLFEGIALMETMIDYMLLFFKDDQFAIFSEFLQPDIQEKLFSCFDEKHRPKSNEWNGMVFRKLNSIMFGSK